MFRNGDEISWCSRPLPTCPPDKSPSASKSRRIQCFDVKTISDRNLKESGNYGAFSAGIYNGQGGSLQEENDGVHFVSRFTWPFVFNGQILELGVQGYTGNYVVLGSPIRPLGAGEPILPAGTRGPGTAQGSVDHLDQRLGWSAVYYPQPWGFQAEWTIGRGPALNEEQTALEAMTGVGQRSYEQFVGQLWRVQFQLNY